jgi:hypothetical protein
MEEDQRKGEEKQTIYGHDVILLQRTLRCFMSIYNNKITQKYVSQ